MTSARIPPSGEPNAWARRLKAFRASGAPLLDLTAANPTRVGLDVPYATLALIRDPARRYEPDPLGDPVARAAVVGYYAERGLDLAPQDVCLTTGTSEAYAHAFRLLCDPGQRVLVPRPSYPLFEPLASAEGVHVDAYCLAWDGAWHLDLDSLERSCRPESRAVIVVQPNHPTGSCLDAGELEVLERFCESRALAIVADEVFSDFPWNHELKTLPSLLGERRVATLVLSGISKVCGLPHMKVGWIALAGPAAARTRLREGLEWLGDLFLSVASPQQHALPHWLAERADFQSSARRRISENLSRIEWFARDAAFGVLPAAGGWVATLRVPDRRPDEDWALALLERGVVVHPGHFYDFESEGRLVVSLIVEADTFSAGIRCLAELVGRD